jgi:hypothetical protein
MKGRASSLGSARGSTRSTLTGTILKWTLILGQQIWQNRFLWVIGRNFLPKKIKIKIVNLLIRIHRIALARRTVSPIDPIHPILTSIARTL